MLKISLSRIPIILGLIFVSVAAMADQSVEITPSLGILGRHYYFWTLGLSVDLYVTANFSLTPEFFMANKELSFKVSNDKDMSNYRPTYFLQPGVMINYHNSIILAGAGIVCSNEARYAWHYEGWPPPRTVVWEVSWSRVWNLKFNIGLKISKIRLTVFFLNPFDELGFFPASVDNSYAATVGYTF